MKKFILSLTFVLMASPAFAETVFLCNTTNGKQIKLVDNGNTFIYQFSKGNKSELNFSIAKDKIEYTEGSWNVENGQYMMMPYKGNTYTLFSRMVYLDENRVELATPQKEAGVIVNQDKSNSKTILCNPKQIKVNELENYGVPS